MYVGERSLINCISRRNENGLSFLRDYPFYSSLQLLSRLPIAPGQDMQGFEQSA